MLMEYYLPMEYYEIIIWLLTCASTGSEFTFLLNESKFNSVTLFFSSMLALQSKKGEDIFKVRNTFNMLSSTSTLVETHLVFFVFQHTSNKAWYL